MTMTTSLLLVLLLWSSMATTSLGFHVRPPLGAVSAGSLSSFIMSYTATTAKSSASSRKFQQLLQLRNSVSDSSNESSATIQSPNDNDNDNDDDEEDPMALAMMDAETRLAVEKAKKANELRAQEVFMTKSTGKHKCTNCEWEYDETKGDAMMIGGMIKPGTTFAELPSNWRCPVCRASKDSFQEVVEEIPGFAVNQGYGLGTNAWTSDQKSTAIFGGLFFFFLLFLSGYAMS